MASSRPAGGPWGAGTGTTRTRVTKNMVPSAHCPRQWTLRKLSYQILSCTKGQDDMKTAKMALMILGSLLLSLSGLPVHAQQPGWQKVTADAKAARQNGNFSQAATLYKQALNIQEN